MGKLEEKTKKFALMVHLILVPTMLAFVFMSVKSACKGEDIIFSPIIWVGLGIFTFVLSIFITNTYTRKWFKYDSKSHTLTPKDEFVKDD